MKKTNIPVGCKEMLDKYNIKTYPKELICNTPEENSNCPIKEKCEVYLDELIEYYGG